ncbi:MAG: transposase [Leptospiraceae bacterium]|nr:transposase [Leptospiraceae bacterium]
MRHDEIFELYVDYLLSSFGEVTATGLSALTGGIISHDRITRSLSEPEFGPKDLWKEVKPIVKKVASEDAVIAFDDSILEKPYTDENEMISWHYSHTKNRNVKGINLLTGLYYSNGISIPVSYYMVKKTEIYIDKKTGKEHRKSPISKNEIVRDLSQQIIKNGVKFKYFLTDSWFSSTENMMFFKVDLQKDFIMGLKSNRLVAMSLQDKKEKRYIPIDSIELEKGSVKEVFLEGVRFPLYIVKKVFINEDESTGILYLITSDPGLSYNDLFEIYQKRWKIEDYHKSIKQNTAITKSQTKTVRTQSNHIFASLCAFVKLEKLRIVASVNQTNVRKWIYFNAQKKAMEFLKNLSCNLDNYFYSKQATA